MRVLGLSNFSGMVGFSSCKINLGLNVMKRRAVGFHDIETLFFEVAGLCDVIEVQVLDGIHWYDCEDRSEYGLTEVVFSNSGLEVDCAACDNLCVRAWRLLQARCADRFAGGVVPGARIHLHKVIPMGSGLGAGSANATEVLKIGNRLLGLNLSACELEALAAELGSDTSFFVKGGSQMGSSRGEILAPYGDICGVLSGCYLVVVKTDVHVSTAQAFGGVTPREACRNIPREANIEAHIGAHAEDELPLPEVLALPIEKWKELLVNDFEASVFARHPTLREIKSQLYTDGAVYAAMSGSGAAIYGIFKTKPNIDFTQFCGFTWMDII